MLLIALTVTAVLTGLSVEVVDALNSGSASAVHKFALLLVRSKRQILPSTSPA